MKKIVSQEERIQLQRNAMFLEGHFHALHSTGNVTVLQVFICLLCGALSVLIQCYIQRPEWALVLFCVVILFGIFFRFPVNHIQYRLFYLKTKKRFLRQENISVNWATVVRIDEDNYRISYMEDEAFGPDGKPYIVDCVATARDCRCVVKGQRIILVHITEKNGKEYDLPMIPKKEFTLFREKEKCGPVNVIDIIHVPHTNAFYLKDDEVLFHSFFWEYNMAVNLSKYGYESRYIARPPMALFVYERMENEFELKMYRVTGNRFRYGDILKKKRMKFTTGEPQFYFVKK